MALSYHVLGAIAAIEKTAVGDLTSKADTRHRYRFCLQTAKTKNNKFGVSFAFVRLANHQLKTEFEFSFFSNTKVWIVEICRGF